MEDIENLRKSLIKAKSKLGLTNLEMASDIGCSESTIRGIVSGRSKSIFPRTYFAIEKWLLGENNK